MSSAPRPTAATLPATPATPAEPTAPHRTLLTVHGMHCGSCVRHVQDALAALPGVSAEVDLAAGRATVARPPSVRVADLLAALDEAGYAAADATPGAGAR